MPATVRDTPARNRDEWEVDVTGEESGTVGCKTVSSRRLRTTQNDASPMSAPQIASMNEAM